MRRVLKLPGYRPLLAAYTLNELAWAIGTVALAFLVYHRTHSALGATAFFLCSQFVPALLSPMLVARVERRPARRILPALYAFDCMAFLALAWIASNFTLVPLLVLAAIDGVVALAARSLARATTVAVTSPAGLLREGNAVANTAFSICFMAGPAVGGALVVAGGASVALLTNSGLFALIALTLAAAAALPAPILDGSSVAGRVRASLRQVSDQPMIRKLFILQAAAVLFFTISIPVEVVFAQHTLHVGAGGYGGLLSAWGGGAVAGSAIYARWRWRPQRQLIAVGSGLLGLGFVVMAVAPSLAVAIVGAAIAGVGNGMEAVSARTALQEVVEPGWMAMMMSLNESMFQLVPGAGILLGGVLTELSNPRVALWVGGVGSLIITVAAWAVLRPAPPIAAAPEQAARLDGAAPRRSPASAARHQ